MTGAVRTGHVTTPPDAFDVLAATRHPDTMRVRLADRTVVRTPSHPEHRSGNALHVLGPPPSAAGLREAIADARARLGNPRGTPSVVTRAADHHGDGTRSAEHGRRSLDVLLLPDAAVTITDWSVRDDLTVRPPTGPRAWHGVAVLQRHATPDDEGEAAARSRGGRDELLRWRVDGRRRMVGEGRARVMLATRFGSPVGAGTLVWAPEVAVGEGAAGLAVVTDVVVHPAHRGLGVATTLVRTLLAVHLADFPRARVATTAASALRPALARRGWRLHDRLAVVPAGPAPADTTA